MKKNRSNYSIFPTVSRISESDIRNYRLDAMSKADLVRRIELLESEMQNVPRLESEVSRMKKMESEVLRWKKMESEVLRLTGEVIRLQGIESAVAEMKALIQSASLQKADIYSTATTKSNPAQDYLQDIKTESKASSAKLQDWSKIKVGDYVTFGKYQEDPIEWQVLEILSGKAILISRYGLDAKEYHDGFEDITWEQCTLRSWLNYGFYQNAFSAMEQRKICRVKLINPNNIDYKTKGGNSTEDKVFLLSIAEAERYYANDKARRCEPTAYAKKMGAYINKDTKSCCWWLRSPGYNNDNAAYILSAGTISKIGNDVYNADCVVRPVICLKIEA